MGIIHFLNVLEGDCSLIQHASGHNTLIDICNGNEETINEGIAVEFSARGNFGQKNHPVNPIEYLKDRNIKSIFRFILTHPDMDHIDGIEKLFKEFEVLNFWDTDNNKEMNIDGNWGRYKSEDWQYYQNLRSSSDSPKTLNLYSGEKGKFFNISEDGTSGGDGIQILSPTEEMVNQANESKEYNDSSYVLLYRSSNKKIIFAGDSEEKTWNYILENFPNSVKNVDVLIAPHHGRKSGGNDEFLDILKPKLTLFGNAKSEYLDYNSWNSRGLKHITNNQANCVILNVDGINGIEVYVTNEKFAKAENHKSTYNNTYKGWYLYTI